MSAFGWRCVFWVNVPVGLAGALLGRRWLPRLPGRPGERLDVRGALALAAGLTALLLSLGGLNRGRAPAAQWPLPVAALACLAGFVAVERRARQPLLDLRLFRLPSFCHGYATRGASA